MGAIVVFYAVFLRSIGFSFSDIALVEMFYSIVVVIAEIPTGMLADGRSRAWSLKTGVIFQAIGALVYMFAQDVITAIIGEIILAIGMSFISGAKQAWITDALSREGKSRNLRKVFATDSIFGGISIVTGGIIGGILIPIHIRVVWIPLFLTHISAWCVCMYFMNGQGEPFERIDEWSALRRSIVHLRKSRALIWLAFALIVFGTVASFSFYWSLYFIPEIGNLGISSLWTVIYLGSIASGFFVRYVSISQRKESLYIVLSILFAGIGLVLIPFTAGLFIPLLLVILHEVGRGMFQPLTDSFMQHRIESSYRATFGSLQSFIGRTGFAIVPFIIWISIDGKPDTQLTIGVMWIISGAVLIVSSVVMWLFRPQN
ncbi:MFS transporter [Candidatus Uhrbacteria bacterium]|nr:MFS transporter [Candidatus Uhrbacteria bacterium]